MKEAGNTGSLSTGTRTVLGVICVLAVLLLIAGAASIPFVYESQSIRYKFGMDKIFLRFGKVLGMTAGTLLLLQLSLGGRFRSLGSVFPPKGIYLTHRLCALTISVFAVMHPLLVFAPEDIMNIPPDMRLWPEILGAVLLTSICMHTAIAFSRNFLGLSFARWSLLHRMGGLCVVIMLLAHVLFVSDSFEKGPPRVMVIAAGAAYCLLLGWTYVRPLLRGMRA